MKLFDHWQNCLDLASKSFYHIFSIDQKKIDEKTKIFYKIFIKNSKNCFDFNHKKVEGYTEEFFKKCLTKRLEKRINKFKL